MQDQFTPIADTDTLEQLVARSTDAPVILFKHDTACPISARAYRELSQLGQEVCLLEANRAQELSNAVTARTGVRHETPQVIVLRNGQAVWSASHYDVTRDAVIAAARQNT